MRKTAWVVLLASAWSAGVCAAQPSVVAGPANGAIVLDGALDEPAWAAAGVIPELTQQAPSPGKPSPYATRVMVLADRETLYIGFVCADPRPEKIAVHTLQRDADLSA